MSNNTKFQESFNAALLDLLKDRGVDAVEVTGFDDRTVYEGFCETCSYEYTVVDIFYKDSDGRSKKDTYEGSFANLIQELS